MGASSQGGRGSLPASLSQDNMVSSFLALACKHSLDTEFGTSWGTPVCRRHSVSVAHVFSCEGVEEYGLVSTDQAKVMFQEMMDAPNAIKDTNRRGLQRVRIEVNTDVDFRDTTGTSKRVDSVHPTVKNPNEACLSLSHASALNESDSTNLCSPAVLNKSESCLSGLLALFCL